MTNKKYDSSAIKMFGMDAEFKFCHLPFIVVDDVLGCIALEGTSGSGKTTLAKRLGKLNELATGGKVKVFSADKARYEDFIGIPIPDEKTGRMKVYPMDNSVSQMETVVIDEANRANYENQEKWMSLIATREIDGLDTRCKYIYLAMNPVLGEGNDTYEGVMPLDKAMGERIYALITMSSFSKLPKAVRYEIMKSSVNNQTSWNPTEEDVHRHSLYVAQARQVYGDLKNSDSLGKVLDYIDAVQMDLKKETKGHITIEARRAQFIVTNILAVHALNRADGGVISLEDSAVAALSLSFPNRLWEQPINNEALRMSHERFKNILKSDSSAKDRAVLDFEGLESSLNEVENFSRKMPLPDKEQISKVINQSLPDEKEHYVNHLIFSIGAVKGLTLKLGANKKQGVMKQQEFERLSNISKLVEDTSEYKKYKLAFDHIMEKDELPENMDIPTCIAEDAGNGSDGFEELVRSMFGMDSAPFIMGVLELAKVKLTSTSQFIALTDKIVSATGTFSGVADLYASKV